MVLVRVLNKYIDFVVVYLVRLPNGMREVRTASDDNRIAMDTGEGPRNAPMVLCARRRR
jgi:hypothetical protein